MRRIINLTILLFTIISCGPASFEDEVMFEQAQPEHVKSISNFSKNIQGVYLDIENHSKELVIQNHLIKTSSILIISIHRSEIEIDSSDPIDIFDDQEIIKYLNQFGGSTTIHNDSIFYRQVIVDTVFLVDNKHVLKKLKGKYFLNYLREDNLWKVKMVEIRKDSLFIGEISPSETLLQFDFVKKKDFLDDKDSIIFHEYIVNPAKKDLKKMLKSKSFDNIEIYIRKYPEKIF